MYSYICTVSWWQQLFGKYSVYLFRLLDSHLYGSVYTVSGFLEGFHFFSFSALQRLTDCLIVELEKERQKVIEAYDMGGWVIKAVRVEIGSA